MNKEKKWKKKLWPIKLVSRVQWLNKMNNGRKKNTAVYWSWMHAEIKRSTGKKKILCILFVYFVAWNVIVIRLYATPKNISTNGLSLLTLYLFAQAMSSAFLLFNAKHTRLTIVLLWHVNLFQCTTLLPCTYFHK